MIKRKKMLNLIFLGLVLALPIYFLNCNNLNSGEKEKKSGFDNNNLLISTVSGKIHIENNSGWVNFRNDGNCTGNGTYSDPYVIKDLVIDGGGTIYNYCIWIENSDVHFKIKNCTVYNSHTGILLSYVNNSQLINNNCSSNFRGIRLEDCNNNTISGNTANNIGQHGIHLEYSDNNVISGNIANNLAIEYSDNNIISRNNLSTHDYGIILYRSTDNNLSGNIMNECGLKLVGFDWIDPPFYELKFEVLASHIIDTTNLVNGNPLIYYTNEENLEPNNFTNAGQVILVNCTNSLISNINFSDSIDGISLYFCNNSEISGNTANNNAQKGIYLFSCNNNTIFGNTANDNGIGIYLELFSNNNMISGNTVNGNWRAGIYLDLFSNNNTISGNSANDNGIGIYLDNCDYNTISENTANNNSIGIQLFASDDNDVLGNTVDNNRIGIYLYHSDNNFLSGNTINNSSNNGIYLDWSNVNKVSGNTINNSSNYGIGLLGNSDNNTITQNLIIFNNLAGIVLDIYTDENIIYLNCFNNSLNAVDNGSLNNWDNGIKGNYWADYTGLDADDNGIGDVPYYISGSAGSKDNFPLMKCQISKPQKSGGIPGYNLFFLLIVLSLVAITLSKKFKKY